MKTQKQEEHPVDLIDKEIDPLNKKTAFFITPLGPTNSDIRRATNGIISAVIRPVLDDYNIFLVPPHEILDQGNINQQVITHILNDDLVIANLTDLNANVMYELAVRHATRKPVIVIAETTTKLPFDIASERTIFFDNDMAGVVQLTEDLRKAIPVALADTQPNNPIYFGLQQSVLQEITVKDKNPVESYIIQKLSQIDELNSLVRNLISIQANNESPRISSRFSNESETNRVFTYHLRFKESLDGRGAEVVNQLKLKLPHIIQIRINSSSALGKDSISFQYPNKISPQLTDDIYKSFNLESMSSTPL